MLQDGYVKRCLVTVLACTHSGALKRACIIRIRVNRSISPVPRRWSGLLFSRPTQAK